MKRGRGRPPKTPTFSSKILNSGRRGSHHGGPSSPRVSSPQGVKTRDSNRSIQRKNYFEGIQFSESDSDSDSSYESSVSSVPSYKSPHRLRVIPMRSVTPLKLPPSSDDIILPPEHVLQALSIYEVLRQFGRILRLSPFRYEDFCAAIDSAEQSVLLSQIHMALFRALLLEDETNGYTFAASDEKDSLNIFLHEVDCFTWPEHIRSYFFSDKSEFGDLFDLVCGRDHNNPFPFVSIEDRLKALKRLCDLFLASNTVREVIINEGITESEDHCRSCCKMGDLLCCENCPAVYHLHCLKPPLEIVPEGDWLCPICDEHRLKGVTECHADWTKDGWLRHTPIGTDREGRKYWFLSRRLFVESEDETVRYYSSKTHFDELIEYLEVDGQERRLLSALKTKYTTIVKHMAITMSLVEASRGNMTSGLLPRRKDVEEKKSSKAVADQETVKEEETSPKVSLTFVPDTAVVKMVTKGNQESPNEVESDRRLIAMKQHEEIKEGEANSEEMEEGENSSPDSIDTNSKTLGKKLDIDGNESVKREAIDLSCASDVQMDSESPEQIKTETNSSQKSEENTTEKISDNVSDDTSCDKAVLLNKQPDNVDSPINATTSSGSSAVSLNSVRKVIDFGSSESSQTLGTETKETEPCKVDPETKHLVQNNDVEQNNKKDNDPDLIKPVKQESEPENPETEPVNQGTEMEVPKDEESKMKTEAVIKQEGDQGQEEDKKEIKEKENKPTIKPEMPEPKGPFFRLGMEGNFTAYVNQYATNPLALNKNQHMEYKERKRSVNNKFSVEHEFKISGEIFGPKDVILNTLRCSIVNLENNIPAAFMHPIWPLQRSTWVRAVHIATTPEEFGAVLIFLESLIRPLCFIPVWRDALGHVELHRAIVETKAERAARKREHKEEDEEVEVQHRALVNYSWVPMHQIWKQKGEEYRIFKGGGWTWHSGMSARKRKHCFTKDRREFECKKRKLCKVVDNFINKREEKKKEAERRTKAKLAVQAYKENMKSTQSVTQGNIVKQVVSTPKPSNAANTGVQLSKVSQSMATSAAVQQGLSVVNVPGGIKYLLQSGSSATQSSSLTQVTQSMSIPKVTPSTGATQGTPSVVVPQLSSLVQVTKSSSVPKVTQSVVVPQVTQLPGVMQVTQSSSVPKVTLSAGATQVTQSIVVPQVTQLSGVMEVAQSSSVPKVTPSAGVTQVTQSIVVPQVTQLPSVMQVTQSSSIPKVTPSAGVTQVTQSVVVPQAPQFSGVVQVTQSSSVPKVTTSADVTQVMQSTGAPLVTPLSGVMRVTQSTSMPQVSHSAGVTQLTQSLGVPQVTPLSGVVRVTETTSIPKVTLSAGVTQVTQSIVVPQVTPLSGVVQVTQSTTAPKVTYSKDVALDQQSTHNTVNQTVNDMKKVPAIPKEEVVSHVSNVIGVEPQKDVIQISSLVQPTLLSGLTQSAALAQTLPIATGLQPLVTSIVQQKSETVPVNVMSNDIMPKLSNITQPTLEFSDSKATQSLNSTVTNSSNSNPDLMGSSAGHRDAVQAKDSEQRCSGTKASPTLSQTLLANDSTEVSTKPGSTQGNALDIPDSSSDVKTASSNSHDILLLTDKMDINLVPPSDELLNDESKNDTVSSANKEGFPNESCFSSAKCTLKSAEQDGSCSVAFHCTYDLTEDDDWIIIQSNKHLKPMDSSRTSVNNSKSYNCLPSSNAVDVDLTDSLLNIRNETKKETSENALANSIDIHEENRTTLDLNIPRKTTVEYNSGEEMSNDKQTTQDNMSSHNTEEKSDLNTFSASKNVSSSSANVPGSPQLLLDSQTLVTSSQATSSNCQDTSYCNRSPNTSNPESNKVGNSSSTQSFVRPSATSSDNLTAETQAVLTAPSSITSTPNTTFATFTATPTVTASLSTSSKYTPVVTPLATAQSSSSENMAVETKDAPSLTLRESTFVATQATSLVSTPVSTSAESMDIATQATSLAAVTPSSSTLTESIALKYQATSVTLATPSLTLCQSTPVATQATSLAAVKPSSSTLTESITVDNHETSSTEVAPSTTFSESASVATQATALAVASTSSVFNQNMHVDSQGTSVSATVQSSTLTTKSTSVATQPTPLAVTAELSKDIPVITQVKPSSSVVTTVAAQPKSFTAAAQSSMISSQNIAQKTKGTLLTVLASPTSTALTQIPPLSVTVPSATLRQSTSSVNQATQPSVNAVSSSQIRNLLTQATLPVTVSSDSTSLSQNVTLITQAAHLPSSQNSNVVSHTALLSSPSSAASIPLKSLASVSTAAIPASTINLSGLPITASSLKSVPITSSGVVKVAQGVIQDPKNNVNVTSSAQESLGMTLTKTLINTAMKASQNVPVGSAAKQVTVASTQKIAQPKVVKTVSATRPQAIAAKPTQQLRAIAPQPTAPLIQAGQTTVLQNSPQTSQINFPLLSGNTLQGGVVKISTPGVSNPGTPVNNIAALVASLPGNAGTPGQPQLIRFVTPSGASFTVQGTIQPGPQGSAAGSTTINVPKRLLASSLPAVTKPVVVAPKTVAATTNRTTVTIPRSQQPVVSKVTKTASTPEKKENYPVLEPLVKDPRKLIDRVMSKWRNNRCSVKSVFQLKKHERRILGRRAGMREVPGYMYVTRGSGINWPPSFPRPSFKVAWRYRSRSLRTLAGAGLQARILHACLKWEDINIRPPRSNSSTICTGTGTTSSEVINHRYVTPDGLKCEYLVRKIVRTMRKPAPEIPRPPPPTVSKRGRTLRPKINLQPDDEDEDEIIHTGPRVFESWCPESELELWEVRQYNERKEREKALEREKKLQEEASRRAAELRAAAIQRRQQEQQVKQQQQILKKKVQNAIKTQQKKLTNVSQATPRAGYKPITMETMAASGITSAQVIRPATVPRQQVPQVTNLVTQYRPASLKQTRVPIGSPATGMIRTVTRAQVNYRPLATTTQAKISTPGVTPTVKSVSNIPYVARGLGMNAPKMKHSSKELQQAKQQIAKAKGKKSSGTGVGPSASKKHVPLETRQELNRIGVCRKLIDHLISKIERSEEQERNKESKRKAVAQKQQRAKANKLDGILYKRKELLKKEIIRKRAVLEKELTLELSKESKKETPTKKRKRESSFGSVGDVLHDKKQKAAEEVYCICRKPYDPTMFYIGCDLCANWFHGECVGVTPESAEAMEQFTCSECSKAQQGVETEELYCLCRQPYDEAKFYIGCDTCHDWFHGSCVGITEGEAEMLDSYFCPRCKESQSSRDVQPLSNKDYDSLKRLLRSLQSHKMAWPFLEPVSADDVPGYYDIIKEPMDLSKVEDRLSTKHYHTVEQFNADITTMFDNCRFFNPKESPYYRCAEVLEGFFVKKLRAWQKKA